MKSNLIALLLCILVFVLWVIGNEYINVSMSIKPHQWIFLITGVSWLLMNIAYGLSKRFQTFKKYKKPSLIILSALILFVFLYLYFALVNKNMILLFFPIFSMMLTFILGKEKVNPIKVIIFVFSFISAVLLILHKELYVFNLWIIMISAIAGLLWAMYSGLSRQIPSNHIWKSVYWQISICLVISLIWMVIEWDFVWPDLANWQMILPLATIMALMLMLWSKSIQSTTSSFIATISYMGLLFVFPRTWDDITWIAMGLMGFAIIFRVLYQKKT